MSVERERVEELLIVLEILGLETTNESLAYLVERRLVVLVVRMIVVVFVVVVVFIIVIIRHEFEHVQKKIIQLEYFLKLNSLKTI